MPFFGLLAVVQLGKISLTDTLRIKACIVVSVNGVMMGLAVFHALHADADLENLSVDSTSIKAHPHSAGAKKGL